MARKTPLTSLKQINEINLTPLMDLTFILLITFIITFPLIEQGILVTLPKAKGKEVLADEAHTISIRWNSEIYLDDVPMTLEEMGAHLLRLSADNPDVAVMVRADERIKYGELVKVLKTLNEAKIGKMSLVTQEE